MDVEAKRKIIDEKKAKAEKLLEEIKEDEEDLKTYLAGLEVVRKQEREVTAKAKAVTDEQADVRAKANAIEMATAFVRDKDIEGAKRYLLPLVKQGKLTAEEADAILTGGSG